MQIFEAGKSVASKYIDKSSVKGTFVCVVDNAQEKTIDEALQEIINHVGECIKHYDADKLCITTNSGETYTLAHEVIVTDTEVQVVPSNMLRHTFSRFFTIDSLYIDEYGEYIDLSQKGFGNVRDNQISILFKDYVELLELKPDYLLDLLDIYLIDKAYFPERTLDIFRYFHSRIKIKNLPRLERILSQNKQYRNMEKLAQFSSLMSYLNKICGLEFKIQFVDVPIFTEKEYNDLFPSNENNEDLSDLEAKQPRNNAVVFDPED